MKKLLPDLMVCLLTCLFLYMSFIYISTGLLILGLFVPLVYLLERFVIGRQKKRSNIRITVLKHHVTKGEEIPVKIRMTNPSSLPILGVKVVYEREQEQECIVESVRLAIPAHSDREQVISFPTKYCGKTRLKLREIIWYDWLSLFGIRERKNLQTEDTVYIYPQKKYQKKAKKNSLTCEETEEETNEFRSSHGGTESSGVRDYRQGDFMRAVHWKLTAKKGSLQVKEFQNEVSLRETVTVPLSKLFTADKEEREKLLESLFSYCMSRIQDKEKLYLTSSKESLPEDAGSDSFAQSFAVELHSEEEMYLFMRQLYDRIEKKMGDTLC